MVPSRRLVGIRLDTMFSNLYNKRGAQERQILQLENKLPDKD